MPNLFIATERRFVAISHARSGRRPHGVGCSGYHSTWHQLPEHVTNVHVLFWDGAYLLSRSTQRKGGHQLNMADNAQHRPVAPCSGKLLNMAWFWGQIGHVALSNKVVGGAHVSAKWADGPSHHR